ncbi:alkaline phosphatase D family protein [Gimesia maris]|uniref:alkaline phosphatase D family protein n=1 Tax=Gimesia maris TaxID=122 RepID=UPI003A8D4B52
MRIFCLCCLLIVFGCEKPKPEVATAAVEQGESASIHSESKTVLPQAGMGIMVGEVTSETALVQVRLTKTDKLVDRDVPGMPGVVIFSLSPYENEKTASKHVDTQVVKAAAEHDFIARAAFNGLMADTEYECKTRIGETEEQMHAGPTARFKTLPGASKTTPVDFVVVTGMNYAKFHGDDRIDQKQHLEENNTKLPQPYSGPDKHLGYPALETILKLKPDFFIGTGDNVYYDTPDKPRAKTIPEMRQKWHEQFVQPRYRDLFAAVPTYWEIDDHDYRIDDGDNTGEHHPTPAEGRAMMLEQLPVAPMLDTEAKTYRTHRLNKDLQIWLPENRMYRSPNAMEDGPEKTIWGAEQKAWLKKTLKESNATFKLLVSPTPMIGPDDLRKTDNHCDIGGFRHERDEFFNWLKENGLDQQNFFIVCGDRHWQYHAIDPSGFEEFSSGALVDANSRLGRKAGDPKSTDPEGLIKQPYLQEPRSGGFLLVKVTPSNKKDPATLSFLFHDEKGKLLYQHDVPSGGEKPAEQ